MKYITIARPLVVLALIFSLSGCIGYRIISPEVQAQLDQDTSAILFAYEKLNVTKEEMEELELSNGNQLWTARFIYSSFTWHDFSKDDARAKLMHFCESIGGSLYGYHMHHRTIFGYQRAFAPESTFPIPERSGHYTLCHNDEYPLYLFYDTTERRSTGTTWMLDIVEWPKDSSPEQIVRDKEALGITTPKR